MKTERRRDAINLFILILVGCLLGIYLIASTVLISKDGALHIEHARLFPNAPVDIATEYPPGYPFLISAAHKFVTLFTDDSSVFTWIYSAQSITLLCRLLGLVPLYFIGKLLVGSKRSFYAMLILILLPHPAKMSCEVSREWPYILFLAAGFLCLLLGAQRGKWWTFGLAGLSAGLGCWIRPACAQLVVYGFIWLTLSMFWPRVGKISRPRSLAALASLFVAFALPALPCIKYTGYIISPNAAHVFKAISHSTTLRQTDVRENDADGVDCYAAGIVPAEIAKALGEIFRSIGENLMWFFMPPLLVGFCHRLLHGARPEERFLITILVLMNLSLMVCRYCYVEAHISNRWSLPVIVFTIFYICDGLQVVENWLSSTFKFGMLKGEKSPLGLILLLIGITICLPKLLRPVGADKRGFRTAATWLKNHTGREDAVAVPDGRISFYAEREGLLYRESIPERAKYVVGIVKGENEELDTGGSVRKELSLWVNEKKKAKRIVLYTIL